MSYFWLLLLIRLLVYTVNNSLHGFTLGILNFVLASVTIAWLKPEMRLSGVNVGKERHLWQSTKSRKRIKFSEGSSTVKNKKTRYLNVETWTFYHSCLIRHLVNFIMLNFFYRIPEVKIS